MSERLIIENRSQHDLAEIVTRLNVEVLRVIDGLPPAPNTLVWSDGLVMSFFKNKRSVRVVAHQNDGVDHKETP